MIQVKNYKWIGLMINVLFTLVMFLLFTDEYNLHHFINFLFYTSFFYLMLWLLSFILKGRFFDGVVYGFRRFGAKVVKKDLLDEWADKTLPSERISENFLSFIFFQGIVLTILMIGLLIIFYM